MIMQCIIVCTAGPATVHRTALGSVLHSSSLQGMHMCRLLTITHLQSLCAGPAAQAALDGLLNLTANYSGYRSGTTFSSFNLERKIRPEVLNAMLAYMRYDMQLYGHSKMLHQLTVQGWQAMTEAARHEAMLHKAQEQQGWQQLKFSADGKVSLGMQHAQMRPLCPLLGQLAVQGSAATSAAQHQVLIS